MAYDFQAAINQGLTKDQITSYLQSKGRQAEAEQYFNPKKETSATPGFGSRLVDSLKTRGQEIKQTFQDVGAGKITPMEGSLQYVGKGAAGTINDLIGNIVQTSIQSLPESTKQHGAELVKKILETPAGQMAVGALSKGSEFYSQWAKENPRIAKDVESVVNIASLLPVGKAAEVAGETATKAVIQGAETGSKTLATTGRIAKGLGQASYDSAITPTVREAEKILAYEAKVPWLQRVSNTTKGVPSAAPITRATTAAEKGIAGTERMIGRQASREAKSLWQNTIQPALDSSTARVTKDDLFAPILRRIESTVEPGRKKSLENAFNAIQDEYSSVKDFSLPDAQKVKSELDNFTPSKIFRGQEIASEYRTLQNDMANAIRQKIYGSIDNVNIRKAYLDYANLDELEKVGVKAISEAGKKAGSGALWSSLWSAATTPVKTVGGKILYRVGNNFEFLGEKGIKKFGDFLKGRGFRPPVK